jgi:hypothetical protein
VTDELIRLRVELADLRAECARLKAENERLFDILRGAAPLISDCESQREAT